MAEIAEAAVHAFYLFDVAQAIRLGDIRQRLGSTAPLQPHARRPAIPPSSYTNPPIAIEGSRVGLDPMPECGVEVRFYDYGVVSLRLTFPFEGRWAEIPGLGDRFIENERLEQIALHGCKAVVERFRTAMDGLRTTFLSEDYFALTVMRVERPATAEDLVKAYGSDIAQFLRGELQPLSAQERDEVLKYRLSYLQDDLVIPTWNAAFVYDRSEGVRATLEILELVNSQLLEFRYHDDMLDTKLARIYDELQHTHWRDRVMGRRYARATTELHALFIDVNELTDRVENAVKVAGDLYGARLITVAGARLGLDNWKTSVEEKLKTLDDIYRFAVEQTGISQANLLELVITLILVIELGLLLSGLTK